MLLIDPAERARRLGNVAAILIALARRARAAESSRNDSGPAVETDEQVEGETG